MIGRPFKGKSMRSLRSGVALTALAMMWSSAAFGFNLFGSSDDSDKKPKPAAQAQAQPQQTPAETESPSVAKTLAANLDSEIEKAKAQRLSGDLGGAAHAFAQMVLVAPDDARVCGEYGKTLVSLGRSDDAVAFLKRAIELRPNDWTLYSAIGAAFDQKSQFADAKTAYQRGLQLNPTSAALLNNYAMSRMLAGDLPAAQALIAQAQAAGNDPKIAHNAALMTNLRGQQTADVTPSHPVTSNAATPATQALPKPVATATLPPPQPVKTAIAVPTPAKAASVPVKPAPAPVSPAPQPVKTAIAAPTPVKTAPASVSPAPQPVKTAIAAPAPVKTAPTEKPVIVKTETGRVMMQAVPKDPEAGPVKTAETAEPAKVEAAPAQEAKAEATSAPRALASAAPAATVRNTPDLRAASD
jgi:Flp pilus assembly protein TadD